MSMCLSVPSLNPWKLMSNRKSERNPSVVVCFSLWGECIPRFWRRKSPGSSEKTTGAGEAYREMRGSGVFQRRRRGSFLFVKFLQKREFWSFLYSSCSTRFYYHAHGLTRSRPMDPAVLVWAWALSWLISFSARFRYIHTINWCLHHRGFKNCMKNSKKNCPMTFLMNFDVFTC